MRMIDLFSGIGGFHLAAEAVWGEDLDVVTHCEKDAFCQQVLKKHWPDVPCVSDILDLKVDICANLLYDGTKEVDIMPRRKDPRYDHAVSLYNEGLSIQDCAEFYGITRQAMHKILQRRGCKFRSQLKYQLSNHFYRGGRVNGQKRAGHLVEKAIKKGILAPQPCQNCGANGTFSDGRTEIQSHHDDYNRPLEVKWLCQ